MDVNVKIVRLLDAQSFVSKKSGEEFRKYSFLGETKGQYLKTIMFSVMGDERWQKMALELGAEYQVSFDIDAHEWNGRWYNEIVAWKAVLVQSVAQAEQKETDELQRRMREATSAGTAGNAKKDKKDDDLPF